MDPLSTTASIIALLQAAQVIINGVQKIRNASKELLEMKEQARDTAGLLTQINNVVKVVDSKSHGEQDTSGQELLWPDELEGLKITLAKLKHVYNEFKRIVQSALDRGKLNRLILGWKDAAVCRELLRESRRLRANLDTYLKTLAPIQLARHSQQVQQTLQDLRLDITGSRQKKWEPSSNKTYWHRYEDRPALQYNKPPPKYTAKHDSPMDYGEKRTEKVLYYTALNKPRSPSPDARDAPDQSLNRLPKAPSNEPSLNENQSEGLAERRPDVVPEPCAVVNEEQSYEQAIVTLAEIDAQIQQQEANHPTGSVSQLLDLEEPTPPEAPDSDPVASQISGHATQGLQTATFGTMPEVLDVPKTWDQRPLRASHYNSDDFRDDHLNMHPCSCPRSTTLRPPYWLGLLFGSLTLAFCMLYLPGSLLCYNATCRSKAQRHMRLQLQLPLWLATNTCLVIFCWDSVYGLSRFCVWQKIREIEAPDVALAIEKGDVRWLQRQVASKKLQPFDIMKGTGDLLTYSLMNLDTGCGIEVTNFLFRAGFHSLSSSYQGCTASYMARLRLKVGIEYEQRNAYSLLQDIADLEQNPGLDRSTVLHDTALRLTNKTLRDVFISGTGSINDFDGLGFTALHWSVMREDMPHVKALLKAGADVNMQTVIQKWSPLHLACMRSSREVSAALLESGAKLELEDYKGRTPLHYIPIRNPKLANLLLSRGADPKHEDDRGDSVLHNMACGELPFISYTRRHDEYRKNMARDTLMAFYDRGVKMDTRNSHGETPTMLLAIRNASIMGHLFEHDLLSFKEPFPLLGWSIMHYAAYYWDYRSIARLYFESEPYGPPPEFDPDAPDHQGITPLDALEYRMFVPDEQREPGVYKPTRKEVTRFVALLSNCRRVNWSEGYYLETKKRFLEDGSRERMEEWLTMQNAQSDQHQSQLWQETDPWWRNLEPPRAAVS